jgi:hypothetical protein
MRTDTNLMPFLFLNGTFIFLHGTFIFLHGTFIFLHGTFIYFLKRLVSQHRILLFFFLLRCVFDPMMSA